MILGLLLFTKASYAPLALGFYYNNNHNNNNNNSNSDNNYSVPPTSLLCTLYSFWHVRFLVASASSSHP